MNSTRPPITGLVALSILALSNALGAPFPDPKQEYWMENQFSGHVVEGGNGPPNLQDQFAPWRRVVLEAVEKGGKTYYKIKTKGDGKPYWGPAPSLGAPLRVDKKGNGDAFLWELIPYIAPGNKRYGLYMLKNVETKQFLRNKIAPKKTLDLRDPKREEMGITTGALIPNDRRFLWAFGVAREEPIETLAVPQGGWDTSSPTKLAVLCVKNKLKEPVYFSVFIGDKAVKGKAVYWGQYWNDMHYYVINLNHPFFSKPGKHKLACAGKEAIVRIVDHAYIRPYREWGKDRFSLADIFDSNLGAVGQWGHLCEWYPNTYDLWKRDLKFFPRWMWRDESDSNKNKVEFEPVADKPEVTRAEANLAYQGTWDITDRYYHNYALDGVVMMWLSEMYRLEAKDDPILLKELIEEMKYGLLPALKRQESSGSWRQGFLDVTHWTGTTCSLATGLAAIAPCLKKSDPVLAAKALAAAEKAWKYILPRKDDPKTWAVAKQGILPDGTLLQRGVGSQRNLYRESYLMLALYLYFATDKAEYKNAAEAEIRKGTLSEKRGWMGRDGNVLAGQRDCKGYRLIPALTRYYMAPASSAYAKKEIKRMMWPYYKGNIVKPSFIKGPFGTYHEGAIHPWSFGEKFIPAMYIYDAFGAKYQEGAFLCARAADWYMGCNPFSSSLLYGVGDDFALDGWNSYHAIGRQMSFSKLDIRKENEQRKKQRRPLFSGKHPLLRGSAYDYFETEMEVAQTMEIWMGMRLLDKHRNDKFGVTVFTKPKFAGGRIRLPIGSYSARRLAAYGIPPRYIRSMKIPKDYIATLFSGDDCQGASMVVVSSAPSLGRWSGKAKSMTIDMVGDDPPEKPVCVSPKNGAREQSERPIFAWSQANGATSYNIYLDGKLKAKNLKSTFCRWPKPLPFASKHTWLVEAVNKNGSSKSDSSSFSIKAGKQAPIRISDTSTAYQTTTLFPADRALDGKKDTFTHTGGQPGDYWELRFNGTYKVTTVELANRNGNFTRLNKCVVTLYDADRKVVWKSRPISGADGRHKTFKFDLKGEKGRYLRVCPENGQRNGDNNYIISLAEVVVYGYDTR